MKNVTHVVNCKVMEEEQQHLFNGSFFRTTWVSRYQKGKTNVVDLLEQEIVSGSGIYWAVCKSAPCSRQTTTSAPHHSVFYKLDALPATKPIGLRNQPLQTSWPLS